MYEKLHLVIWIPNWKRANLRDNTIVQFYRTMKSNFFNFDINGFAYYWEMPVSDGSREMGSVTIRTRPISLYYIVISIKKQPLSELWCVVVLRRTASTWRPLSVTFGLAPPGHGQVRPVFSPRSDFHADGEHSGSSETAETFSDTHHGDGSPAVITSHEANPQHHGGRYNTACSITQQTTYKHCHSFSAYFTHNESMLWFQRKTVFRNDRLTSQLNPSRRMLDLAAILL